MTVGDFIEGVELTEPGDPRWRLSGVGATREYYLLGTTEVAYDVEETSSMSLSMVRARMTDGRGRVVRVGEGARRYAALVRNAYCIRLRDGSAAPVQSSAKRG